MLICKKPYRPKHDPALAFDCGNCISCRIKRKMEWTTRMVHHREKYGSCYFLTLTYDQKHVNIDYSLKKRDLQLFFKRLRKKIAPRKITYYACGEYGPRTHRPHYHAILFGTNAADIQHIRESWPLCDPFIGITYEESTSRKSCSYVAGYTTKKLGTRYTKAFKERYPNKEPEFQLQSQGIGLDYCIKNKDLYLKQKTMNQGGKKIMLPRYYRKKLDITVDDLQDIMLPMLQGQLDSIGCQDVIASIDDYGWLMNIRYRKLTDQMREACDVILKQKQARKDQEKNGTID